MSRTTNFVNVTQSRHQKGVKGGESCCFVAPLSRSSSWCFTPAQQMESTLMRVVEEMTSTDQSHSQQGGDWFIPLGKNQGFETNLHRIDPLLCLKWQSPTESVWEVWNIPIWWDTEKGEDISANPVISVQRGYFRVCGIWHWNIHLSWEDFWQYSSIPVSLMSSATLRMNSFPNGLYVGWIGGISTASFSSLATTQSTLHCCLHLPSHTHIHRRTSQDLIMIFMHNHTPKTWPRKLCGDWSYPLCVLTVGRVK